MIAEFITFVFFFLQAVQIAFFVHFLLSLFQFSAWGLSEYLKNLFDPYIRWIRRLPHSFFGLDFSFIYGMIFIDILREVLRRTVIMLF